MEDTTNPDQAKFRLITETALPHKCMACGLNADGSRKFVDFGVSFDYEGAMLICSDCAEAIGRLMNLITRDEHDRAVEALTLCQEKLRTAETMINELTAAFTTIDFVHSHLDDMRSAGDSVKQNEDSRDSVSETSSAIFK